MDLVGAGHSRTLFSCSSNHTLHAFIECEDSCENAMCTCSPGKEYCGHELITRLNWGRTSFVPTSIYRCALKSPPIHVQGCGISCTRTNQGPACACEAGIHYCGNALRGLLNDRPPAESELFQCLSNSTLKWLANCSEGCNSVGCGCKKGRLYCGYEFYEQLHWPRSLVSFQLNAIYNCETLIQDSRMYKSCESCVTTEKGAMCQCPAGMTFSSELECVPIKNTSNLSNRVDTEANRTTSSSMPWLIALAATASSVLALAILYCCWLTLGPYASAINGKAVMLLNIFMTRRTSSCKAASL